MYSVISIICHPSPNINNQRCVLFNPVFLTFHLLFQGAIEYITFIDEPNGILEVCPYANIGE